MTMTKQTGRNRIEWTEFFGAGSGRTWNPVGGCHHDCAWIVDGEVAGCYAKRIAEGFAQKAYPQGFEPVENGAPAVYWRPHLLSDPLKEKQPCGIFLDSMSDLLAKEVPDEYIQKVLDVCARAHWHVFILLTKNAPRILKFFFPRNVIVMVSSPPDYFRSVRVPLDKQRRWLDRSLSTLADAKARGITHRVGVSAEPLSWDITPVAEHWLSAIDWLIVGAATNGRTVYQPQSEHVKGLVDMAKWYGTAVFFKGNLRGNPAAEPWLEEYPSI